MGHGDQIGSWCRQHWLHALNVSTVCGLRSFQNLILLRDHLAALAAEHLEGQRQSAALRASDLLDTHSASFRAEQGAAPSGEAHRNVIPAIVRRAAQCIGDDILTCASNTRARGQLCWAAPSLERVMSCSFKPCSKSCGHGVQMCTKSYTSREWD